VAWVQPPNSQFVGRWFFAALNRGISSTRGIHWDKHCRQDAGAWHFPFPAAAAGSICRIIGKTCLLCLPPLPTSATLLHGTGHFTAAGQASRDILACCLVHYAFRGGWDFVATYSRMAGRAAFGGRRKDGAAACTMGRGQGRSGQWRTPASLHYLLPHAKITSRHPRHTGAAYLPDLPLAHTPTRTHCLTPPRLCCRREPAALRPGLLPLRLPTNAPAAWRIPYLPPPRNRPPATHRAVDLPSAAACWRHRLPCTRNLTPPSLRLTTATAPLHAPLRPCHLPVACRTLVCLSSALRHITLCRTPPPLALHLYCRAFGVGFIPALRLAIADRFYRARTNIALPHLNEDARASRWTRLYRGWRAYAHTWPPRLPPAFRVRAQAATDIPSRRSRDGARRTWRADYANSCPSPLQA